MKNKKLLLALLAVIMILCVSIGPALAYFSAYTVAEGKKTVKVVPDTTITEKTRTESQKVLFVTNSGDAPCFVRAKAFAGGGVTLGTTGGNGWAAQNSEGYWVYTSVLMPGEPTNTLTIPISNVSTSPKDGDGFNIAVVYESTTAIWDDAEGKYIAGWDRDPVQDVDIVS